MDTPASAWKGLSDALDRLKKRINSAKVTNIAARGIRDDASAVAEQYFRDTRPKIEALIGNELQDLDASFRELLALPQTVSRRSSYQKYIKRVQKLSRGIGGQLLLGDSAKSDPVSIGEEDKLVARTLEGIAPSAARSFKQALIDLSDPKRVSYRGPAVELREALRETLDHLAPDDEVMGAAGYQNEKDRDKPTMKQKVRFLLKARGLKDETAPEQAAQAVDAIIGGFARSVYEMSNAGTHGTREYKEVLRIRRYVSVVLHDILAL